MLGSGGRDVGVQIRKLDKGDNRYVRFSCMKEKNSENKLTNEVLEKTDTNRSKDRRVLIET